MAKYTTKFIKNKTVCNSSRLPSKNKRLENNIDKNKKTKNKFFYLYIRIKYFNDKTPPNKNKTNNMIL